MKILRINDTVVVIMKDGSSLQAELSDEQFSYLCTLNDIEEIKKLMHPEYAKLLEKKQEVEDLYLEVEESEILVRKGDAIYWENVSELSMPEALVRAVLLAEASENEERLEAYRNFWILMSLNPDSRCRQNLFWFLERWGMKISKYGLFVGYRNVDIYNKAVCNMKFSQEQIKFVIEQHSKVKKNKKSPKNYVVDFDYAGTGEWKVSKITDTEDESEDLFNLYELYHYFEERLFDVNLINPNVDTVYTDRHSHTFRIKIGEVVSMPRKDCDSVQEHSCSSGLHIGGADWLKRQYFGDTGLICLVNPKDVVAVPPIDDYGKLRTCAYLPIGTVNYDEHGNLIPYNLEDGFKSEYVKDILYNGIMSTEDTAAYSLEIPDIPELKRDCITKDLRDIANKAIQDKQCQ